MTRATKIGTLLVVLFTLLLAASAFTLKNIEKAPLPEIFFVATPLAALFMLAASSISTLKSQTWPYGVFGSAFALWGSAAFVLERALNYDFHSLWSALPLAALTWALILSPIFAILALQRLARNGSKPALLLQGAAFLPALIGILGFCWTFSPAIQAIEGKVVSAAYLLLH